MKLSVIIPTYRRWDDLERLMESLSNQEVKEFEVIVVVGPGDTESFKIVASWKSKVPSLVPVKAEKESVVHAMNLGLSTAVHEVICLIDDDVSLPSDWSKRILAAFRSNNKLGAYGGRDKLQFDTALQLTHLTDPPLADTIGTFRWDGVLIGNHHCGALTSPCKVDVLKGANLSFRRSALGVLQIDPILEGRGAETCWEADVCQQVVQNGFVALYDNDNYVFHYVSQRQSYDHRGDVFSPVWPKRIFNEGFVTAKFRSPSEIIFYLLRMIFIGSSAQPGIIRSLFYISKHSWKILLLPWRNTASLLRGVYLGCKVRFSSKRDLA